ncbi:AAA family ATPase [Variovorax sp. IB41]|uniref:AAA family ATPase n=1 Tax=Variovorax sp. IB41 TaxID=2779370 RepID=UPI0018E71A13|nr:AAA family ATPase [Variovorax sp. IB41]MBJ2156776.1 AAA family ATPase [Variovorax sp. IB41]
MSSILKMSLKNFKGIEEVVIDLDDKANCPVITLIGLNESGKTTILEGLSHFITGDKAVSGLFEGVHAKASGAGLIPLHLKAAFTGDIEVTAVIRLDEEDIRRAQNLAKLQKLVLDEEFLGAIFEITRQFKFVDSVLKENPQVWNFELKVRPVRGINFKAYVRPTDAERKSGKIDLWANVARILEERLPQISYFPTFLVDMPEKIYLKEFDDETAVNRYYRLVFQDVLDSLGQGLNLDKHINARIESFKNSQKSAVWFSLFFSGAEKALIDSVFQKISNAITNEVLGSWQRVFQRAISAKNILVEWHIDTEKDDIPYASLYVTDGESRYAISERSLGFRWFFSFLLFTAFKKSSARSTVFIFDEPAANLHAKAQAELLTSFGRIASEGSQVIYSTHSHHMINPQWLSGAYIVENTALDYDGAESLGLSSKPTNVRLTKYREFVSKFPTRSSYFQPVIEKLEYVAPQVIGSPPFVLVEGISDYYALKLAQRLLDAKLPYNFIPGVGSGACGPQIGLLMGRGERFILLLDDDKAGKKEAQRYSDNWFLPPGSAITLAAVDPSFVGMQLESLITPDTLALIKKKYLLDERPTKKQIGWYLAESYAAVDCRGMLSRDTLENFSKILNYLKLHFVD